MVVVTPWTQEHSLACGLVHDGRLLEPFIFRKDASRSVHTLLQKVEVVPVGSSREILELCSALLG